jgi:hypothetical protein
MVRKMSRVHPEMMLEMAPPLGAPPKVQTAMLDQLRPVTVDPRGTQPDQVLGRVGLSHADTQCLGLKDDCQSSHIIVAERQ